MASILNSILTRLNDMKQMVVQVARYGESDILDVTVANNFGIDSKIPKGKPVISVTTDNGNEYAIGVVNISSDPDSGETFIYSMDAEGKEIKSVVKLKNDGTIEINGGNDNAVRFSELQSGFDKLVSDHNALVNMFNSHMHTVPFGTAIIQSSATLTMANQSQASIDASKVDNVKLP